jgi:hypothetical protein
MTIVIPLTKGQFTIIDDEDADLASFKWTAIQSRGIYYAKRRGTNSLGKPGITTLHRIILARKLGRDLLPTEEPDHWDRDSLNNTRENLRLASRIQNVQNRGKLRAHTRSGFPGVAYKPSQNRKKHFHARITINKKRIYLGCFATGEEAYEAYRQASLEHFGEFSPFLREGFTNVR